MNIGLTYDLRSDYLKAGYSEEETAEFDRDDTIDAIENALRQLGYQTERIGHVRALTAALAAGKRWPLVFNICEGMYGLSREAQVPALLDAYQIPYVFSEPLILALTLHKGITKHLIRALGVATPDFYVVEEESQIAAIDLPFPLFVKPVGEGTGKGISSNSKIQNRDELEERCRALLQQYKQPALVETFLPGREFTVGLIGTGAAAKVIGLMEVILLDEAEKEVYSYVNKEKCEDLVRYETPEAAVAQACEELALRAWRGLNCRDGGRIDIRMDANGVPHFLEVNPLAGLHPEHSDLPIIATRQGISYTELIRQIMESALQRIKQP
jgi:D-alanine-D-alanine ligase